jgi:TPR repeat protein
MAGLGVLEGEQGRIEEARTWYAKAIASGHADAAPAAMASLGNLEAGQGRIEGARTWYAKAIASGHAVAAPAAQAQLDQLRRHQEDLQRAESFAKYGSPFVDADFDQRPAAAEPTPGNPEENST